MDGHLAYFFSDADAQHMFQQVFLYYRRGAEYKAITCVDIRSTRTTRRGIVGRIPTDNSLATWDLTVPLD